MELLTLLLGLIGLVLIGTAIVWAKTREIQLFADDYLLCDICGDKFHGDQLVESHYSSGALVCNECEDKLHDEIYWAIQHEKNRRMRRKLYAERN